MNCEELREQMPAYVLGALTEEEQAVFERHIAKCDLNHEIDDLGETATRIADAAPAMDPPAGLRAQIMRAAQDDLQEAASAPSTQAKRVSVFEQIQRFGAPAYAAAAVLLVAIGALAGWAVASLTAAEPAVEINNFRRDPEGDWLRVESTLGHDGMSLSVGNMDTLPARSTYRLWAIRDDRWIPIGEFNTNSDSRWDGYFEFSLEKGDLIAITVEPEDGSDTPTGETTIQSRI